MKAITLILSGVFLITTNACKKGNEGRYETNISHYNEKESHNMGMNCMSCHSKGGGGEGWFEIAGTVYDTSFTRTYPDVTVRLYTGPNGTGKLKYTIEGDALGNFFTTKNAKFGTGLYPSIEGKTSTKYMSSPITIVACNSCHGNSTGKLWTE